jgi:hypothetical protein
MDHSQHCGFIPGAIDDRVDTKLGFDFSQSRASFKSNLYLARLLVPLVRSVLAKLTTAQLLLFLPAIN